jgi:hypothetical protein
VALVCSLKLLAAAFRATVSMPARPSTLADGVVTLSSSFWSVPVTLTVGLTGA